MGYKLSYNAHAGRTLLGLVAIYMGVQLYIAGNDFYGPYLHAARKALLPGQKNRINKEWTFEQVN